ncbi:hypothetical protein EGK14_11745 [Erwinia sp. 198]|nr:hypothetical protein EGK14_11745 [Erwinia sp. 198]
MFINRAVQAQKMLHLSIFSVFWEPAWLAIALKRFFLRVNNLNKRTGRINKIIFAQFLIKR